MIYYYYYCLLMQLSVLKDQSPGIQSNGNPCIRLCTGKTVSKTLERKYCDHKENSKNHFTSVRTLLYYLEILVKFLTFWPYVATLFKQAVKNIQHKFYHSHCMCQAKYVTLFFVVTVHTLLHTWECTLWKGLKFVQNHLVIFDKMIFLYMNLHILLNCGCVYVIHTLVSCEVRFGRRNSWISHK